MSRPAARPGPARPQASHSAPPASRAGIRVAPPKESAGRGPEAPWWRPDWSSGPGRSAACEEDAASARVASALLGGKDHFRPDRTAAERLRQTAPGWAREAASARALVLDLSVRLAACGISQYLDLGCGLTTGNQMSPKALLPLHSVLLALAPGTRVVYADRDPVVMAHARALLHSPVPGAVRHLDADLARPHDLLAALHDEPARLNLAKPVAVILSDVLHEMKDHEASRLLDALHTALTPGSALLLSHRVPDGDRARRAAVAAVHAGAGLAWNPRTPARISELAGGWSPMTPPTPLPGFTVALLTNGQNTR
ncbi:SAM-dependent methyltransferase [Kitasatospora purpeofusca]|uniref:SAM-dependent methyltransferase n=1 Tax=Kitasatospora purpeofusca TaxID=67352 RepID=UPI0035DE35AC